MHAIIALHCQTVSVSIVHMTAKLYHYLPADITETCDLLQSQIIMMNSNQFQIKSRASKSNLM